MYHDDHMSPFRPQPGRPEPLPAHYEAELRRIDHLLAAESQRFPTPRGLADAVYDATVGFIWERQTPMRLLAADRRLRRATSWGRLSMAAALGLACGVALMFVRAPVQLQSQPVLAGALSTEAELLLFEQPWNNDLRGVDYLIETRDLTIDDLFNDIALMTRELES